MVRVSKSRHLGSEVTDGLATEEWRDAISGPPSSAQSAPGGAVKEVGAPSRRVMAVGAGCCSSVAYGARDEASRTLVAAVPPIPPFIAATDKAWFDFLSSRATRAGVDEVNFWSPLADKPMKHMALGEPVFFRLKTPINAIAGYGFFAHFASLDLEVAWQCFGWKNGDADRESFLRRISGYRRADMLSTRSERAPLGCTILRAVQVWPAARWIPWGESEGWARNIVRGKTERDAARAVRLLSEMQASDQLIPDLDERPFAPLLVDERRVVSCEIAEREGQGAFRARLLDAYGRSCAITGEHTQPVLDAAHI